MANLSLSHQGLLGEGTLCGTAYAGAVPSHLRGWLPPSVTLTWFAGGSLVLVGSGVCASSELHQLLQHRGLTSVAVVGSSVSEF